MTTGSSLGEKPTVNYDTTGLLLSDQEKDRTSEFFTDSSFEYGGIYFSAQQGPHFNESLSTLEKLPELVAYTPPSPVVASPAAQVTVPENQGEGSVTAPAQQEEAPVTASTENASVTGNQEETVTEHPVFQEEILTTIASAHQGDHFVQTAISYAQAPPLVQYTPPTTPPSPAAPQAENEPVAKETHVKKINLPIKKDRRRRGYHGRVSEEVVEKPKQATDVDQTAAIQEKTVGQECTVPNLETKQTESASDLKNAATTLVSEAIATIASEAIDVPTKDVPIVEASEPEPTNSAFSGMPQGSERDHLMDLHGKLGTLEGFGQTDANKSESGDSNTFVHNNYELEGDNTQDFLDDGASYGGSPGPFQDFNDAASFGSIHSFPKDDPLFNFDHQSIINQVFNPQVETINPQFLNLQSNTMDNRAKSPVAEPPVVIKPEPSASKKTKQKRKITKDIESEFEDVPLSRNKRSTKSLSPSKDSSPEELPVAGNQKQAYINARIELPKQTRSRKKALVTDTNVKTEHAISTKKTTPSPASKKPQTSEKRSPPPPPQETVESHAATDTTTPLPPTKTTSSLTNAKTIPAKVTSPPPAKATSLPPTMGTSPPPSKAISPPPAKATSLPPTEATPPPPAKATPPPFTKATSPVSKKATPPTGVTPPLPKKATPPPTQTFENENKSDSDTESDQEFVRKPRVIAVEKSDSDSSDSVSSPPKPIEPPRKTRPSERRRKVSPVVVLKTPVEDSPSEEPFYEKSPMKPLSALRKSRTPTKSHSKSPKPRASIPQGLSQARARYHAQIKFKRQAKAEILRKRVPKQTLSTESPCIPSICISTVGVISNTKRFWDDAEFRGNTTLVKKYGPSTRNTQGETSLFVFKGPCHRPNDYEIKIPPTQDTGLTQNPNVNTYFQYALGDGTTFGKYDVYDKSDPVYFRHTYSTTRGRKEILNYKTDTNTQQSFLNSSWRQTRKRVASLTPEDWSPKKQNKTHASTSNNTIVKKPKIASRQNETKKRATSVVSSGSGWSEPELKKQKQDKDSDGPDSGGSTVTETSTYFSFARSNRYGAEIQVEEKIEEVMEDSSDEDGDLIPWGDEDRLLYQSDEEESEQVTT